MWAVAGWIHRSLGLGLIVLAACGGAAAPAPVISNRATATKAETTPLAGRYAHAHPVEMVCDEPDGWCDDVGSDELTIAMAPDGALDVTLELVRTNGHTCSFADRLLPVRDSDEPRWRFDQDTELDGPCTLELVATSDELEFSADGCRYYCGTRASLDATFARDDRVDGGPGGR